MRYKRLLTVSKEAVKSGVKVKGKVAPSEAVPKAQFIVVLKVAISSWSDIP